MRNEFQYDKAHLRDGKLYLLHGSGILVMKAWPPAAWRRDWGSPGWKHCRPDNFDLRMERAHARLNRTRALCDIDLLERYADFHQAVQTGVLLTAYPDRGAQPEPVAAIIERLARVRFAFPHGLPCLGRLPERYQGLVRQLLRQRAEVEAFRAFYEQIPGEVREAVAPFPERHYSLVSFCARCPGALDLLHSTPALALMLANCWCFGRKVKQPLRSARALLRKTQREQLAWLGLARPGKSAIRVLRKLPTALCTVELLLYLRDALNNEEACKRMAHLPRLNRGAVFFLSDPRLLSRVTHHFLAEVAQMSREEKRPHLGHDMRQWLDLFLPDDAAAPGLRFNSVHDFQQHYADVLTLQRFRGLDHLEFPPPPVPGTPEIVPITTPLGLLREGQEQHHCIASYAPTVARGRGYAYEIHMAGERATLFVEPDPRNRRRWFLAECHGFANAAVSAQLYGKILDWLEVAQSRDQFDASQDGAGQLILPGLVASRDALVEQAGVNGLFREFDLDIETATVEF